MPGIHLKQNCKHTNKQKIQSIAKRKITQVKQRNDIYARVSREGH